MSSRKAANFATVPVALALLASACGSASGGAQVAAPTPVRISVRATGQGPMYIEGAIHFVEVRARGEVAFRARLREGEVRRTLEPGTYTIAHWARPCVANCGFGLDPPTDRCSARLEATEDVSALVRLRARGGCTISFAPG
jgi:hypothetical protein